MKIYPALILAASLLTGGCAGTVKNSPQSPVVDASPAAAVLIISATYGSGTHFVDVTYRVNNLLRQPNVVFYAHPNWLGADPTPGWNKAFVVVYEYKGQRHTYATGEGGEISIADLVKSAKKHREVRLSGF
jgi:hypothetical protein